METALHFEEYIFAGARRRSIFVRGTAISGSATAQRIGVWTWFLRRPDGTLVGEGAAPDWTGVIAGIQRTLARDEQGGHLAHRTGDVAGA